MQCSHCHGALTLPFLAIAQFYWPDVQREMILHKQCLISLTSHMTVREIDRATTKVGWTQLLLPFEPTTA